MADETRESPERPDENGRSGSDSAARTALRAAAIAAGTTAVTAAARRALRSSGEGSGKRGTVVDALVAAWDAAEEHVLPHAENAMESIGRFLATDAPEVIRERLVPRLVEAFEDARADEGGTSRSG
jgi:hypothetical protein